MKNITLTKKEFVDICMPLKGNGKDITEAPMELLPVNKGLINGNLYQIEVNDKEGTVNLTKVEK